MSMSLFMTGHANRSNEDYDRSNGKPTRFRCFPAKAQAGVRLEKQEALKLITLRKNGVCRGTWRSDYKFSCKEIFPPFEFIERPAEISVPSEEGKQEVFWSDHPDGNN